MRLANTITALGILSRVVQLPFLSGFAAEINAFLPEKAAKTTGVEE